MDHLHYYTLLRTIRYKSGTARARGRARTHKLLYWALGIEYFQCYCKPFLVFPRACLRYYLCALLSIICGCICCSLPITLVLPVQLFPLSFYVQSVL